MIRKEDLRLLLLVSFVLCLLQVSGSIQILEGNGTLITAENSIFFLTCQGTSSNLAFVKDGRQISDKSGFTTNQTVIKDNSTILQLTKPVFEAIDAGVYSCLSDSLSVNVTVKVEKESSKFDKSYSFAEGEDLLLNCPVLGISTVTWYKDDQPLDNNRTVLSNVGIRLQISALQLSDRGNYRCLATWDIGTKSYTTLIRVRGKLAPLWPFIGIVVEILILVCIIVFCKDKKKKIEKAK